MSQVITLGETIEEAKPDPSDVKMFSVTTLIGAAIDKSNPLTAWTAEVMAERSVANLSKIERRLRDEGEQSAIEYVKQLRWQTGERISDTAKGTISHELFKQMAFTGVQPKIGPELHPDYKTKGTLLCKLDVIELRKVFDNFSRFLDEFQPEYTALETVVFDEDNLVAGQVDFFATIAGVRVIGDYKTSAKTYTNAGKLREPHEEVGLQLAGYRFMPSMALWRARRYSYYSRRYYLLSSVEREQAYPVPEVDGGIAVYVTPERYGVYPVRCGEEEHEAFLAVLDVARWKFNRAQHVIGNPMIPPFPRQELDDPFVGLPA